MQRRQAANRASRIPNDTIGARPMQTMNVCLTDEQELLRAAVREFAEAEIRPHVHGVGRGAAFPAELLPKLAELGLMGIQFPEAVRRRRHVGRRLLHLHRGAGARRSVRVACRSRRTTASAPRTSSCSAARRRSSDTCRRSRAARSSPPGALTEAGVGQRRGGDAHDGASRDGDGWVLNGTKQFITHGSARRHDGRHGGHRPREGQPRHLRLHRRARHAGLRAGQEGRQARHARQRDERGHLRELPRARRRSCSARKGRASSTRCRCSTPAASASRRWRSGWRRAPTRRRAATRSSGKQFGQPIGTFQAIRGSWPTPRRASRRRGC